MKKGCVAVLGANLAWMTVLGLVTVPPLAFLAVHETIVQQHETTVRETTVHHHHTTSNHCPAMPPTAPDPVVPAAPPANNPTAPGNAAGSGSVSAPSAPGVVIAGGVPGAPESPGLVVGPWNPAGGGSDETLTVSGTLSSPINGELSEVDPPASSVYPGGRQWTSNGTFTPPGSGWWANLYQQYLVTPEAAFLETIAPKENYTAAESQEDATKIVVKSADLATTTTYWLYDDANQELFDGLTRWVDAADGGMADQGAATIAAGKLIVAVENFAPLPWNGGTATTWDAAEGAEFGWAMAPFFNGSSAGLGFWYGLGPSPMEADWQPFLTATGVPLIEASGELLPPDAVCPAWQSSAPTAPGNAAGSGSVSAPSAPAAIQAGGQPSAPGNPAAVVATGQPSAPSAPDPVQG